MACLAAVVKYLNVLFALFLTCKFLNLISIQDGPLTLLSSLLFLCTIPQMVCTVQESKLSKPAPT